MLLGNYGIIKVSEEEYGKMDKSYILSAKKQPYGYDCLTNEKQFYIENYPTTAIENGDIDSLIVLMLSGKQGINKEVRS